MNSPMPFLHIINEANRLRLELIQAQGHHANSYVLYKSLFPYGFTYVIVPLYYPATLIFPNHVLPMHPILSLLRLNTLSPQFLFEYMIELASPAHPSSPSSLSTF